MKNLIKLQDVWFAYNGEPVLEDVSLQVRQGDFMAIIGPNGGGKTTLMKIMLGLLKPQRGKVQVFDEPPDSHHRSIGYVPQDVDRNRNFPISVFDVVGMGLHHKRHSRQTITARIEQALERVDMLDFKNRRIGELSGGQTQRVMIARALVTGPELLMLDEPTASIDSLGQQDFYEFLKDLNREVTIIVISHDYMALSSHIKSVTCVNRRVFHHEGPELSAEMLDKTYRCPVELIAHGLPHRVLHHHGE